MEIFGLYFGIADWVIVGLLLLFLIIGVAKGFVKQLLSLAKGFVALIVALFTTGTAANFLSTTGVNTFFYGKINPFILDKFPETATVSIATVDTKEELLTELNNAGINKFLSRIVASIFKVEDFGNAEFLDEAISSVLTLIVLKIVAFIVIFILTIIILAILIKILEGIVDSSGVAKFFDKLLGLGFGALKGVVVVSIIALVCGILAKYIAGVNDFFTTQLFLNDDSVMTIGKFVFNTNPLSLIFRTLFG